MASGSPRVSSFQFCSPGAKRTSFFYHHIINPREDSYWPWSHASPLLFLRSNTPTDELRFCTRTGSPNRTTKSGMGTPRHWAAGRHEIALGKENHSPHPLPWSHIKASCSSSLCPILLCSKIFLLQPQSLGYKMMALASLNSKGLSSTAFCFVSFWVLPPDLPLPCPLPPAPISLTPSPAMRKLIEGDGG